jgi:tRNA threonylcarbamoyladenosine modification (KEOPS) complex Cgi121 subunit
MFELKGTFGRCTIGIVGGRATVDEVDGLLRRLARVDRRHGTVSQIFDASRIAGRGHLLHAARLALIAQATGKNFASSLNIELACWVAGERQIGRALEKVGLHKGGMTVAVLTVGRTRSAVKRSQADILHELRIERDDDVVEFEPKKIAALLKVFSIPKHELEIADIRKLVLERIALLSLQR